MSTQPTPVLGGWDLIAKLKTDQLAMGDQFTAPQPQADEPIENWFKSLSNDMKTTVSTHLKQAEGMPDGEVFNGWTQDQKAAVQQLWQVQQLQARKQAQALKVAKPRGLINGALGEQE